MNISELSEKYDELTYNEKKAFNILNDLKFKKNRKVDKFSVEGLLQSMIARHKK